MLFIVVEFCFCDLGEVDLGVLKSGLLVSLVFFCVFVYDFDLLFVSVSESAHGADCAEECEADCWDESANYADYSDDFVWVF